MPQANLLYGGHKTADTDLPDAELIAAAFHALSGGAGAVHPKVVVQFFEVCGHSRCACWWHDHICAQLPSHDMYQSNE